MPGSCSRRLLRADGGAPHGVQGTVGRGGAGGVGAGGRGRRGDRCAGRRALLFRRALRPIAAHHGDEQGDQGDGDHAIDPGPDARGRRRGRPRRKVRRDVRGHGRSALVMPASARKRCAITRAGAAARPVGIDRHAAPRPMGGDRSRPIAHRRGRHGGGPAWHAFCVPGSQPSHGAHLRRSSARAAHGGRPPAWARPPRVRPAAHRRGAWSTGRHAA